MGSRLPSVQSAGIVNTNIVTNAETVIVTSPPFSPSFENQVILIFWKVVITVGASTTFLQGRIRRGTTTGGVQVNVVDATPATPAINNSLSGCYFDIPGVIAGQQYSFTVVCGNATANSTVTDACIIAMAL